MMAKSISVLGSTGSIGQNALKVVDNLPGEFSVRYLTAGSNARLLVEQARKYTPRTVALVDADAAREAAGSLEERGIEVLAGREGLLEIARRDDVDLALNALVGSSGMEPTVLAIRAGVDVALSNKESLVMAGALIERIKGETGARILPVDSEHSAIWQCLVGEDSSRIRRLILTGSGGPFRTRPLQEFSRITVQEALTHPNWKMGSKITIDSATMMNKGLEVIEAHWLFRLDGSQIDIVIHPQSIIHSMVEFIDGSIKAQLGLPDMKIPIQYALTFPERRKASWETMSFPDHSPLTFEEPDLEKFPLIALAYACLEKGGSAPACLNVANDHAVKHFLDGDIPFQNISEIVESAVREHPFIRDPSLEDLLELETWGERFVLGHLPEETTA
ncbi:MAG: 1-deoxy-D-xylulose-5-phosphate reductoisomerase [Fidelibacterota bacterium]